VEAVAASAACGAEVAGGERATAVSPHMRGRVIAGTRGHGPSWASRKQALPLNFVLNFKINTNFVIQVGDIPDVQTSPNFAGR
jgi:hypothetical protein